MLRFDLCFVAQHCKTAPHLVLEFPDVPGPLIFIQKMHEVHYTNPAWRKRDLGGALRISPDDADRLGLTNGAEAKLVTKRASAVVTVAVDDKLQAGHIALPNGFGLDHVEAGERISTGVGTNEFTASEDRDPWAGTPWHKTTPARLELV